MYIKHYNKSCKTDKIPTAHTYIVGVYNISLCLIGFFLTNVLWNLCLLFTCCVYSRFHM